MKAYPLVITAMVFGLVTLMIVRNYEPTVIAAVVTASGLAAAELVRRLRESSPAEDHRDRDKKGAK